MVLFTPHPLFKSPLWKHPFGVNNLLDWKGILMLQGRRKAPPIQQQLQKWREACCKESWCEVWPSLQSGQTLTCNGKFPAEALCWPGLLHQPGCLAHLLMCQRSCYCFSSHFTGLRSDEKALLLAAFPSFCVLSNANPGNSSDKTLHIPVWPLHSSISICPADAGVHLQCAASCFVLLIIIMFLFTNSF